ncbi:MAG: hypothetical protein KJ981_20125 [Alphaproteobacteria bacterium]|nr:hypothetical protein [Alphaproteobacteria bacterium]MBU0834719.1 hypothetical protein [Alphaproteobacteria bacterium]MBU1766194.1 hypothetical protein [Alphaproteobacteria bacterium]
MLTAGEQRNALFGPAREQLKSLVSFFEVQGNNKQTLGFSNARLAYDDILARMLFFIEAGGFGEKSSESRISERFRQHRPFESQVVRRCEAAIHFFSSCRDGAMPTRFNKASTLSWLLFFSRFERSPPDGNLIQDFLWIKDAERPKILFDCVEIFEDRSSLRVTDVSSVVYRDFILCYFYHFIGNRRLPDSVLEPILAAVHDQALHEPSIHFEHALSESLSVEAWSRTL